MLGSVSLSCGVIVSEIICTGFGLCLETFSAGFQNTFCYALDFLDVMALLHVSTVSRGGVLG